MSIIRNTEVAIPAFLKGNGEDLPLDHNSDLRRSMKGSGRTLEEFAPKRVRKAIAMMDVTELANGASGTYPAENNEHEEAVTKAAAYFAIRNREMADLRAKLDSFIVACRERDARIDQLTISLEVERTRSAHLQNERDDAIGDRALLEALFASLKVQVDAFNLPPRSVIPPRGADGRHEMEAVAGAMIDRTAEPTRQDDAAGD